MGAVRYTVSVGATVPLRFDDQEFIDALRNDDVAEVEGDGVAHPLAKALGVDKATEANFDDFIADGVVINARAGITGDDETEWYKAGQGEKDRGWNLTGFQRRLFSMWVKSVEDGTGENNPALRALSSPKKSDQEAAFGALPLAVYKAYLVRVRVHADKASAPAVRDPNATAPKVALTDLS